MSAIRDLAGPRPALIVAPGPRAAQSALVREIDAAGSSFEAPLRVVVPSRALRDHLRAALLAERGGRALAGVIVQTLSALARDVLERSAVRAPAGAAFFDLLVRRLAATEPDLDPVLAAGPDAWRAIAATVRDLIDAGLTRESAEALDELLEATQASSSAARVRARAIVQVAAAALDQAGSFGSDDHTLGPRGARLALAAEAIESAAMSGQRERALDARGVIVFGFANVTGVAGALIDALVRHHRACVILDRPVALHDASDTTAARFTARFEQRCAALLRDQFPAPAPPRIACLAASSPESELRLAAESIRWLLDMGIAPESIGVAWRQPRSPQATLVRRHFTRLGIPYCAPGLAGTLAPDARRAHAFAALLRSGPEASIDALLDATITHGGAPIHARVRLALRAAGAARVHEAAALDVARLTNARGLVPLPQRRGQDVIEDPASGETRLRSRSSTLDRRELDRAVALAREVVRERDRLSSCITAHEQKQAIVRLASAVLGWRDDDARVKDALNALRAAFSELPATLRLQADEALILAQDALEALGRDALTAQGGGVRVLSATEARGQTFEHLFVLGVSRDAFPRSIVEDALLPDALRWSMTSILEDLPVKGLGFAEERYLFQQLLTSARHVVVSWPRADERGRPLAPSPLAVLAQSIPGTTRLDPPDAGTRRPRTALEAALVAGLAGDATGATALDAEAARAFRGDDADRLAAQSAAVIAEFDRPRADDLGPYLGFVGSAREANDPRRAIAPITFFENLARCPWQAFLVRRLGLAPGPDPQDALPGPDRRLVGIVVHAALARLVEARRNEDAPSSLQAALLLAPITLDDAADLEISSACSDAAREVAHDEGLLASGYEDLLAELAAPRVRRALALETSPPLAAEVEGRVTITLTGGGARDVLFRADRLSRDADGFALIDFKTSKPITDAKRESTRLQHVHAAIREGRALQAAAYARSIAGGTRGRYVHIPADPDREGVVAVESSDGDASRLFDETMRVLIAAQDAGELPPRLVTPQTDREPLACSSCDVKDACLQGDSTARQRMLWWERAPERGTALTHPHARALWLLHTKDEA